MKGCINNKMGQIQIDTDVIALYAGTTAVECFGICLLYTSPSPRDQRGSRMPSSA